MPTVQAVFEWKTWFDAGFFFTIVNLQYAASILLFRSRILIMGPAYDCLFYWKALFTCQAAAPACVNLRPSSKAHSYRPNVLSLVLKFQYCNIGYWASISRSVFGKKYPAAYSVRTCNSCFFKTFPSPRLLARKPLDIVYYAIVCDIIAYGIAN